jgi:hypothetical protein
VWQIVTRLSKAPGASILSKTPCCQPTKIHGVISKTIFFFPGVRTTNITGVIFTRAFARICLTETRYVHLRGTHDDKSRSSRTRSMCSSSVTPYVPNIFPSCKYLVAAGIIQGVYKRMVRFQKLTRHLFLTLHGQTVHRQQWQLSKFFMH